MADLAQRRSRDRSRSRGQLILVTALTLAAVFLGLAVIVNSAIFTENLATRNENVESTEALEYRHAVEQYTGEIIAYANEHNHSDYNEVETNVEDGIIDATSYTGVQHAAEGASVSLDYDGSTEGVRIYQNNSRNFTSNDTSEDWDVVEKVENTRAFELNITKGGDFDIIVDGGADEWRVAIRNDSSGDDEIEVFHPDGPSETCSVDTISTIDLTGAEINGSPCPALIDTEDGKPMQFGAGVSGEYKINFDTSVGGEVNGTYSLVVEGTDLDDASTIRGSPDDDYAEVSGPGTGPYVSPAMYSAKLELVYETARLSYRTDVTVAPGEPR